jgi:hypothetical protein
MKHLAKNTFNFKETLTLKLPQSTFSALFNPASIYENLK